MTSRKRSLEPSKNDHQLMWTFVVLVASLGAALLQIRSPRAAQIQGMHRSPAQSVSPLPGTTPVAADPAVSTH